VARTRKVFVAPGVAELIGSDDSDGVLCRSQLVHVDRARLRCLPVERPRRRRDPGAGAVVGRPRRGHEVVAVVDVGAGPLIVMTGKVVSTARSSVRGATSA
jgi:hypothetical protein